MHGRSKHGHTLSDDNDKHGLASMLTDTSALPNMLKGSMLKVEHVPQGKLDLGLSSARRSSSVALGNRRSYGSSSKGTTSARSNAVGDNSSSAASSRWYENMRAVALMRHM